MSLCPASFLKHLYHVWVETLLGSHDPRLVMNFKINSRIVDWSPTYGEFLEKWSNRSLNGIA